MRRGYVLIRIDRVFDRSYSWIRDVQQGSDANELLVHHSIPSGYRYSKFDINVRPKSYVLKSLRLKVKEPIVDTG